jgi:hypothetical protein
MPTITPADGGVTRGRLVVIIDFEARPRVLFDVASASEECRVANWGRSQAAAIIDAIDEALGYAERRCGSYSGGDLRRAA